MHAIAGASFSTVEVTLDAWTGPGRARVQVENLLGEPMVDWRELRAGDSLEVELVQSGEVLVRIEPDDPQADTHDYTVSSACILGCDREYTRYPVLLMHGMAGTDSYIGLVDYWFQMDEPLTEPGFMVLQRTADAFNGVDARSAQWLAHLDAMESEGLGRRFNLIAHSQGGVDARYVTSVLDQGGRIASVVTVATPHRGTSVADLSAGIFDEFPVAGNVVDAAIGLFGGLVGLEGGALVEQLSDLTRPAMEEFNMMVPDLPGVYYASWAGRSCQSLDFGCRGDNDGETVDPLLSVTHGFLVQAEGDNDGLIPVESSKWGDYQGTIPADHFDEVGQIADVFNGSFDHKAFYLAEVRRLAARGL